MTLPRLALAAFSFALLAAPSEAQTVFQCVLNGFQETPPTGSLETGEGIFYFNPGTSELSYDITVSGLTGSFTVAHIHLGEPGVSGGPITPLAGGPLTFQGSTVLSAPHVAALLAGDLYVNVHSDAFPAGELRGQIVSGLSQFAAFLNGAKGVPPIATAATAHGVLTINPNNTVTYGINFSNLTSDVTVAHLHDGRPDENGAAIFAMNLSTPVGTSGTFTGQSAPLSEVGLAKIRAGQTYVNVHSVNHPGGEIRGQMVLGFDEYGDGCNGNAVLTAIGSPTPGGIVTLDVTGGTPNAAPCLLLISPLSLDANFPNGCSLLVNGPLTVEFVPALNGNGAQWYTHTIATSTPAPSYSQLQFFGADPNQPGGYFNTNGLTIHVSD